MYMFAEELMKCGLEAVYFGLIVFFTKVYPDLKLVVRFLVGRFVYHSDSCYRGRIFAFAANYEVH